MPSTRTSDRIYLSPPDMTDVERRCLLQAFDSGWIAPLGPDVERFEAGLAARCGVERAVALSSGTAALHLALVAVGVTAGSEVLVPTTTFVATANAVSYCGASPVLIDVDPLTWQMDASLLAEELHRLARRNRLPSAVVPVDLYGFLPDFSNIRETCANYNVPIVEDAAEALGASLSGRPAGSLGTVGVLSFNGNKLLTTSGGGAVLTDDHEIADRVRYLATQAKDPRPYYWHSELGYNYRLSNLLAALGSGQLSRLDELLSARKAHFDAYREAFPERNFLEDAYGGRGNHWLTVLRLDRQGDPSPEQVADALEHRNIESRLTWTPLHTQPHFVNHRSIGGASAEQLFRIGLCLPSGSAMTTWQRTQVISALNEALSG